MKAVIQLLIGVVGVIYYLVQGTRPKPRLMFDVPWISGVVLSGYRIVQGTRYIYAWLASAVLFVAGFLMHFSSVVLGEYELPAAKAPQEAIDSARRLQWKAKVIAALGFLGVLGTEFAALRRE